MSPISAFDLFTIGIGPSSSHTVGPMRAAAAFAAELSAVGLLDRLDTIEVDLFGSLAATGRGHGTLTAILLGLEGCLPDRISPAHLVSRAAEIGSSGTIRIDGLRTIQFQESDIRLHPREVLAGHSNGMRFEAKHGATGTLLSSTYFSIGGGFIVREGQEVAIEEPDSAEWSFGSAAELLSLCEDHSLTISQVMHRRELAWRDDRQIREGVLRIRDAMDESVAGGIARTGTLPGGLGVRRRAPEWHRKLIQLDRDRSPAHWQEWVTLIALAVNEENASGGRVVTAPTNGAAGIIPAVLHYATHYGAAGRPMLDRDEVTATFLLTAAAVGLLYKKRASISGAEMGCQGEVGSASSMAAAGLAEVLGGSPAQVENAAEIAMEHNLGLTCDPVGGLVQIPCIERNAIAANKAINAARMALWGDGDHRVSLDEVIETMRATGEDMNTKYKETALGGLAIHVNVVEC